MWWKEIGYYCKQNSFAISLTYSQVHQGRLRSFSFERGARGFCFSCSYIDNIAVQLLKAHGREVHSPYNLNKLFRTHHTPPTAYPTPLVSPFNQHNTSRKQVRCTGMSLLPSAGHTGVFYCVALCHFFSSGASCNPYSFMGSKHMELTLVHTSCVHGSNNISLLQISFKKPYDSTV